MASSASRASSWVAAGEASVGAVEAFKDQGGLTCRWNHAIRCWHQHAKNYDMAGSSSSQANRRLSSSSCSPVERLRKGRSEEKARLSEESLRTVMYLSCWGPNQ